MWGLPGQPTPQLQPEGEVGGPARARIRACLLWPPSAGPTEPPAQHIPRIPLVTRSPLMARPHAAGLGSGRDRLNNNHPTFRSYLPREQCGQGGSYNEQWSDLGQSESSAGVGAARQCPCRAAATGPHMAERSMRYCGTGTFLESSRNHIESESHTNTHLGRKTASWGSRGPGRASGRIAATWGERSAGRGGQREDGAPRSPIQARTPTPAPSTVQEGPGREVQIGCSLTWFAEVGGPLPERGTLGPPVG